MDVVEDVEEERLGVTGGLLGLFQLGFRISTFDDFHSSELTGRMALGSINADATLSFVQSIGGVRFRDLKAGVCDCDLWFSEFSR